ncbi:hypothetical protein TIFTF001_023055 [Ficus carica]|uniref:Uncharacterized protein n=1 Tax=Ficus carica TaxID=3494 RepID=A0AA88DF22_FICCA|nr:hypothetical protein TIFTF001_023055 [Ficus carica]
MEASGERERIKRSGVPQSEQLESEMREMIGASEASGKTFLWWKRGGKRSESRITPVKMVAVRTAVPVRNQWCASSWGERSGRGRER